MNCPERWASRSKVLSDRRLSQGARVLFCVIDDTARGNPLLTERQERLAEIAGVSEREIRYRLRELELTGYLTVTRTGRLNRVEMLWARDLTPRQTQEQTCRSDRNECADQIGKNESDAYKERARASSKSTSKNPPISPASGGLLEILSENPNATAEGYKLCPRCEGTGNQGRSTKRFVGCGWCQGRGFMWPAGGVERAS